MPAQVFQVGGVLNMKAKKMNPDPNWIFCRYRRVKGSTRVLDAWDYGYEAWRIPIRRR